MAVYENSCVNVAPDRLMRRPLSLSLNEVFKPTSTSPTSANQLFLCHDPCPRTPLCAIFSFICLYSLFLLNRLYSVWSLQKTL